MSWVCLIVGAVAFLFFVIVINEPFLVETSKEFDDKFFMIKEDDAGSDGVILDMSANGSDEESDVENIFGKKVSESDKQSEHYLDLSNNNI